MKDLWKNLKFAWIYAKDQKKRLIYYILSNIIVIIISIFLPIISAQIIVDLTSNKFYQVLFLCSILFLVEMIRNITNYLTRYFSQKIYRETFIKIQTNLGKTILALENSCIDKNSSGIFIQRLTNDTSRIADIFNALNMYLSNIITNIGIFITIFIISKLAFLYLVIMLIIIYIVEQKRINLINKKDKICRQKNERVTSFVGELVRGVRDIKMLNAEKSFMKELNVKIVDLNEEHYLMRREDRNYSFIRGSLIDLFDLGMIFLLVYLLMSKNLEIAAALVIHNYMSRVTSIINYVSMLVEKVKDFNLSSSRIFNIINSEEFPKEEFGNKHLNKVEGDFEFKNVSFNYDGKKEVLNNISFKIKANETVAFVGRSGAGKTTIFNLLCKMYNPTKGSITINDIDIRELDKESIRGNITIINQNPYIFNLSIKDNLRLVKENMTDEEMKEACKLACLDDFINTLPEGYDTIVGEGGISLSGGQRQRLAIARALIQKTEIILFDEATSALDNETQAKIQQAIDNLKEDYTILIIAHRLSTIINCDRILLLNNGTIEKEGTHLQLLKESSTYKHLYETELMRK